ncbi:MAG: acetylxylan esterase [Acidobacteria bacterium]|nr:acetylxylan esterase [Acidobacteriota bacterium]
MRILPCFLVFALVLAGADIRNTSTPDTDTPCSFTAPATLSAWEARKVQLRSQILIAAGLDPLPAKTALTPIVTGRLERNGYTIEKVAIETMPGYWLGGNLYRPKSAGRHPAVLHPHGHWSYGRLENQPLCSTPTLAINLARNGFVVFAYDMVGYNDTAQTPHDFSTPAHQLWGFTPLGLQLWNSIRAADFLESLPDVDPQKLAMTGASGGGTQTFLLTAVDQRIRVSAPVNMISGIMQGGCICENAPGLRIGTNNIEIAALMAPRPMLAVAATGDWTRNVPRQEYPALKTVWSLYGKPELVEAVQFDAPHNYNQDSRQAVYDFLRKQLLPGAPPFKERVVAVEQLQDMMVFNGRALPSHARTFDQLFEDWKAAARRQAQSLTPAQGRALLRATFAVSAQPGAQAVPMRYIDGASPAVLYVHPGGIQAAAESAGVKKLLAAGRAVLLVDAFQTGAAQAPRDRSHKHFLTFNPSDDAARASDVLAAISALAAKKPGAIEIQAEGKARWWALFAAAMSDTPVRFETRPAEFDASDAQLADNFFVPGLQRAGGAATALRLVGAR